MRSRLVCLTLAVLVATSAHAQSANHVAIRRLDSLWASMYARHDTALALRLYSENLAFTSANGAAKTRQQELGDIRATPGLVMEYFRSAPASIACSGDTLATVSGTADWKFTWNGSPRTVQRGYVITYRRGGPLGWTIVAVRMLSQPNR